MNLQVQQNPNDPVPLFGPPAWVFPSSWSSVFPASQAFPELSTFDAEGQHQNRWDDYG